MSKYLIIWEANESGMPTDSKERGALGIKMAEMVKQSMKEGKMSDWGVFISGTEGYAVVEGTGLDLYRDLHRYRPHIAFQVHQVLSIDEELEVTKSLME